MPDDRTVLDHLLEGRDALVLEVKRLSAAIDELDAVIGQIGGGQQRLGNGTGASATPSTDAIDDSAEFEADEPVNPPVEVEPAPAPRAARPRKGAQRPARKAAARSGRSGARQSESPKSIRVHVLEMLAAEDREFGLAEIIDRVHDAGIQAHDDAVRSITIKLMKDGRVERVGRGQYRLSARGNARHAVSDEARAAQAGSATQAGSEDEPVSPADAANDSADTPAPNDTSTQQDAPTAEQDRSQPSSFAPPLNLGQPWEGV